MTDPVIRHFHETADEFDTIYTGEKNKFSRWLDHKLRWDMYERLRRTIEVISQHNAPSVLDIGAGTGRFFKPMIEAGARHIVAVEPAARMMTIARQLAAEQGISEKIDFITTPFLDAKLNEVCDVSIAIGFYDYIPNPVEHLRRAREATATTMVATFPRAGTLRARIRKVRLSMRGCPSYYYSREQLEAALQATGYSSWEIDTFGQLLFVVALV
jgi:SAM-dependent methyltransferase